jgi:Ca2+-binding RTX toxin-like protein
MEDAVGSPFDDVLVGTVESNILSGLDGDDRIEAGPGNDRLIGGAGNDLLSGGAGDDAADQSGSPSDVGQDTLLSIEAVIRGEGAAGEGSGVPTEPVSGGQPEDPPPGFSR